MSELFEKLSQAIDTINDNVRLTKSFYDEGYLMGESNQPLESFDFLEEMEGMSELKSKLLLDTFYQGYKNGLSEHRKAVLEHIREEQENIDLDLTK